MLNEGVFWTANQLFGIKFVERFDIPVYHPDVRVGNFDHNGVGLALFYGDFFARDSKAAVHGWAILLSNQRLIKHIR